MKTTVNIFRTLLLAVLTLTFGACGEDSLLAELGLDGQTSTKVDGAGEVWDGTVADSFAGGSGTAEAPYLIANGAQLARFASMVNSGQTSINGKLTADILLNDISDWENWGSTAPAHTWTPIGSVSQPFTGTLDGDGHSVSGIYINSEADYQGLVGILEEGGTLQDLGVKASYIKGGNQVGGVCGYNYHGTVTNCYNTGSVAGNIRVGGVCGMNYLDTVTNCYNTGSVEGNNYVGGVCGYNYGDTVTNCYYLIGTANSGIGSGSGEATAKTAEQFQSGEVAWLLQGEQEGQVWGQTIGTDEYPVLGGLKVVQNGDGSYANELNQNSDGFYLISTADELRLFASMVNNGNPGISAKLTADIELNNTTGWENWNESTEGLNSWTPIGSGSQPFAGTLDGDGHSVSGIYINSTEIYQGLVGYLGSGGTLQNLGVKTSYIKGGNRVGGLCGRNYLGTVTNCYNTGNVAGSSRVGGLCGWNDGTVTNCYNTGNVTGNNYYVGGVCGYNSGGTVSNCYNTGKVTGGDYAGGVCGWNSGGPVTNCYNTGNVTGNSQVGGVCGENSGPVTNCYNTGSVAGNNSVGGVCGQNGATVTNCYYLTGTATGGIGYGSGDATEKNADQFQSGEVASLLGEGWGQTIGADDYPVPTSDASKKVYAYTMYQGQSTETGYANNNGNVDLDLASHPNTIAVFELHLRQPCPHRRCGLLYARGVYSHERHLYPQA